MTVYAEKQGYCKACSANRLIKKPKYHLLFWMIVCPFTLGLAIPFALVDGLIVKPMSAWKCSTCGDTKSIEKQPRRSNKS